MREWTEERRAKMKARWSEKMDESHAKSIGELLDQRNRGQQGKWDRHNAGCSLNTLRRRTGWSVRKLAQRIGRSQGTVKRMLAETKEVSDRWEAEFGEAARERRRKLERAFPQGKVEVEVKSGGMSRKGEIPRRTSE